MVSTNKNHEDIVDQILNVIERKAIIRSLISYQRNSSSWEVLRKEMPESLLEKFRVLLHEARKHGFIHPTVRNEKLVWNRVMGFKRNYQNADQCTLCDRSDRVGNCRGRMIYNRDGQRMFKPCWRKSG